MFRAEFAKYNNKIPFLEFLHTLSKNEQIEIVASIDKLLELKNSNNRISEKLSKYLNDGIFELRVNHQNRLTRSLYYYEYGELIVFTNGFIKKTQKTPISELKKADAIRKYNKNREK